VSSQKPRRLQWGMPDSPPPKHPYRDTLVVYGGLAIVVVLIAWVTGGAVGKAAIIAGLFFVVASAWNLLRWRSRLREAEAERVRRAELE
jgi:Zn-dependent protease with chaperone function